MTIQTFGPTCQACSRTLGTSSASRCAWCGAPQSPHQVRLSLAAPAKTPGIAVLLSMLWLGAGHFYANRNVTGVFLALADLLLVMISFTGFGFLLTFPIWLVTAPI